MVLLAGSSSCCRATGQQDSISARRSRAQPQRDRGSDGFFANVLGCAPAGGRSRPSSSCWRGCARRRSRLCPPGSALRAAGRRTAARPAPSPTTRCSSVRLRLQNAPAALSGRASCCARWRSGNGLPVRSKPGAGEDGDKLPGDDRDSSGIFAAVTVERLFRPLRGAALRDWWRNRRAAVEPVRCSPPASGTRFLAEWNDTGGALPGHRTLDELFAAQAAGRRGAAVAFGGDRLKLRRARTPLRCPSPAARRSGSRSEVPVGILVERVGRHGGSGMLAILRAGGAYVPLDPANPASGWRSCSRCGAKVVLGARPDGALAAAVTGPTPAPAAARYRGG